MDDIVIRSVTLHDAAGILNIYAYYVENTAVTFEYEVPTLEVFQARIARTLEKYPYFVAVRGGGIIGYAYAGAFIGRAAYDWSAELLERMIAYSKGNLHDIKHFVRVWSYAKMIGELEGLEQRRQYILEAAAITHDIACPLCREKYGNTNGKYQELEGAPLAAAFLRECGVDEECVARVQYLVGRHHTLSGIDGPDYQILIEADFIANALECGYTTRSIENFLEKICRTNASRRLLHSIFCV